MKNTNASAPTAKIRSLPINRWPEADQAAWQRAIRPTVRLKRGGAASHLREVTRNDLTRRYGYFLDHIERSEELDSQAGVAAYVTPERVERFRLELAARVSWVTLYGSIYKLRRTAQLLDPAINFDWLREIEKDLELVMEPKSKYPRLVYSQRLIDAGIGVMIEADRAVDRSALFRARQFRNGLMLAFGATHPVRPKTFTTLEIGRTFRQIDGAWWICLTRLDTKEKRADERIVESHLLPWLEKYLVLHRPVLARANETPLLWLSSNSGTPMSFSGVARVIKATSLATVGIDVCPHLFRTSAVSTTAVYAGNEPHLGSALLHHRDPRVAPEHYNCADALSATQAYAKHAATFRTGD